MRKWRIIVKGRMLEIGSGLGYLRRQRWNNLKSWVTSADHFPLLCALGLALSSVNFARLAEQTAQFGAPYLLLHSLMTLLVGIPLCFMELGLGQFCQQGVTAVWRAVPALRGVAFVKLTCVALYAICTGVRLALVAAYMARATGAELPLADCTELAMSENGYLQKNTLGMECAQRTFLKNYDQDLFWFAIVCIIIFIVWITVPLCLYSLGKGLKYSLTIIAIAVLILSTVLAITVGNKYLVEIFTNTNWADLVSPDIWFAVIWQILLSNRIGLAFLDNIGGTVFFMSNSIRWSITLVLTNFLFGWLGALFWFSITTGIQRDTDGLGLPLWIYDSSVQNHIHRSWTALGFFVLLLTTASSMLTFIYPIFGSLSKSFRYQWRLTALLILAMCMLCSMLLFLGGIEYVRFLEERVVPTVISVVIFIQVAAFFFIYGWKNLRRDLEFMLGDYISLNWILFLGLASLIILVFSAWDLISVILSGWPWENGDLVQLGLFSAIGILVVMMIFIWAVVVIVKQEEYDCCLKITSSFTPSRKWGPMEPILRHLWIQWSTNQHRADLMTQVRTHRLGTPTSVYVTSRSHSESSASRRSSVEEYERRFQHAGSKSSRSSKNSADYGFGTEFQVYGRDIVLGRAALRAETPPSDYSVSDYGAAKPEQEPNQPVHYGQIKQMYY